MFDTIKSHVIKSKTFLVRYFAQPELEGFAIIKISKTDISNINKLKILRTITSGVNSVSSIYTPPAINFFLPDPHLSSNKSVIKTISNDKCYWRISPRQFETIGFIELPVEVMFLVAYESGISIEAHCYPNDYIKYSRIFTAIIPYHEIGLKIS